MSPPSRRTSDPGCFEKVRVDLLQANRHCVYTQLLRAPVEVALHDHTYARGERNENPNLLTVCNSVSTCDVMIVDELHAVPHDGQ